MNQQQLQVIDPTWILLDTCSTVSVFMNQSLVTKIKPIPDPMTIITNGGSETFDKLATCNFLPIEVHFNQSSLANILSLKDVANLEGASITMDTTVERAINLNYNGEHFKFLECLDGLYFLDTKTLKAKTHLHPYSFVQNVHDIKSSFSNKDIKAADSARRLQEELGWPSTNTLKTIISQNLVTHSPVTVDDIERGTIIYGPPPPLLKGKSTRPKPPKPIHQYQPLPAQIYQRF